MRPVNRGQYKTVFLLLCVAVVLATGSCLFDCADADSDCLFDQSASCCCLCPTAVMESGNTLAVLPADIATRLAPVPQPGYLCDVSADIFNPPKA